MAWQNGAILEKWSQKDVNFKVYLSILSQLPDTPLKQPIEKLCNDFLTLMLKVCEASLFPPLWSFVHALCCCLFLCFLFFILQTVAVADSDLQVSAG